jgi:hypothetical protein
VARDGPQGGLADGLEGRGLGARVLGDAVAHAGHPVAGRAEAVALSVGVGPRVPRPESLQGGAHLRLAPDDDEDKDALGGVAEVGHVPEEVRSTCQPGDHVEDPGHAHHYHELQADFAQCGPANRKNKRVKALLPLLASPRRLSSCVLVRLLCNAYLTSRLGLRREGALALGAPSIQLIYF